MTLSRLGSCLLNVIFQGMLFWEGHPGKVPALHCHIWTAASPVSYPVTDVTKITSRSLLWWFKNVVSFRQEEKERRDFM